MFGYHGNRGCGPRGGSGRWQRGPFQVSWDFGPASRGEMGRGGRRGRMFDGGELRLVLLALIEREARHGYDLIREIETLTGGAYAPSPGVVYPTLTLLEDMGLIAEEKAEGSKKLYAITEAGREHLAEKREEADALLERLGAVGEARNRAEGTPVRRAMHNLKAVLAERMTREGADARLLHEIAGLLDEVAQKVERL